MHHILHLVFEIAAFALGFAYYQWLRAKDGDVITEPKRVWIIIGAAAGALLGSRVLGALEQPQLLAWDWSTLFVAFNNRTIVGGLLGGLIGAELTKLLIGERTSSGDLFTYPLILGMIVGRIGCLLGGLEDNTYGIATSLPWGIDLGDGIIRHPTNGYEILWLGATWLFLLALEKKRRLVTGARFKLFLLLYLIFRFSVEWIKPQPAVFLDLSSIQLACAAGILYYYRVWLFPRHLIQPDA
ncbi:MAG TPA: prolipoprotein diacylglyceryl transferase [Flavobacteriales bacterium]|nr:prolipoprotein diacylglyceryl transferase [Flavobacteriales bacterium]